MSHANQQQYSNTGGQVPSSDIKYDQDLQQNNLLSLTNVFYTEPGSDSSSPLIPASTEQHGSSNVPLFLLRSKPPTTSTVVSTYRDFSHHMEKKDAEYACLKENGSSTKQRRNTPSSFPNILHEILSRDDITDIISWCVHGVYINQRPLSIVFFPSTFAIPNTRPSTNIQITRCGFRRITQGKDQHAYYHEVRRQTARMHASSTWR
eukprot:scaffold180236_cov55-Attheya_sp.AAC.3